MRLQFSRSAGVMEHWGTIDLIIAITSELHHSNNPALHYSLTFPLFHSSTIPLAICPDIHPPRSTIPHSRDRAVDCALLCCTRDRKALARPSKIRLNVCNADIGLQKCRRTSSAGYPVRDILISYRFLFFVGQIANLSYIQNQDTLVSFHLLALSFTARRMFRNSSSFVCGRNSAPVYCSI